MVDCNSTAAEGVAKGKNESKKILRNLKKSIDKADAFGYNRKAAVDAAANLEN